MSGILKSKDHEFTLGHLQTLFSLFEELIDEVGSSIYKVDIRAGRFENLEKFLKGDAPCNLKTMVTGDEIKELKLAKETRNCFIHNNSRVDQKWLDAFNFVRPATSTTQIGDNLPISFSQIEDWNELILKVVTKISEAIKRPVK